MVESKRGLWIFLGIVLVIIIIGSIYFSNQQNSKETIKVGAVIPLSGAGSYFGEQVRNGMLLAQEEINAKGIDGKRLDIIFQDSKVDASEAISGFNQIILTNPDVSAVITAYTGPTLALVPLAEENKIPLLSTVTSGPGIAEKGEYIFRVFTNSNIDAPVSAKSLLKANYSKFGVLYSNDEYGTSYYLSFKKTIEEAGGKILGAETFLKADTDYKTQLLKLKEKGVEVIYIVGVDTSYLTAFKQAKDLRLNQTLAGNWVLASPSLMQKFGNLSEGAYITTPAFYFEKKSDKVIAFNNKFSVKYNATADAYSAFGYDSLMLIAESIKLKGQSSEQVKDGLLMVKYDGLLGPLSFDKEGEIKFDLYPARIENQKIKLLE